MEEQIFQFIWNEWLDGDINILHDEIVKDLNKFYKEVPPIENINHKEFEIFALSYCRYLSKIVSKRGGISMNDVYDFIKDWDFNFYGE